MIPLLEYVYITKGRFLFFVTYIINIYCIQNAYISKDGRELRMVNRINTLYIYHVDGGLLHMVFKYIFYTYLRWVNAKLPNTNAEEHTGGNLGKGWMMGATGHCG